MALARLLVHDLRVTLAAQRSQLDWSAPRHKSQRPGIENPRLHCELPGRLPDLPRAPLSPRVRSHPRQIVERVQTYVLEHYHRPLQLADVAAALHLNPSYVSDLFSHAAGTTFHHYLAEIRLAKAKELLRNPTWRVCEVACAVGYASAESFGHAFRAETGLAPSAWRTQA
jgi:two-component system response regulator YesN